MEIKLDIKTYKKIDIAFVDYDIDEADKWEAIKKEILLGATKNRIFYLYTMNTKKDSIVWELGNPTSGKHEGYKFFYIKLNHLTSEYWDFLVRDSEFYLGNLFLLVGDIDLDKFTYHIFSDQISYKFTDVQYFFMENDGETLCWVNPNEGYEQMLKKFEPLKNK
jgi:hypothetical protein